MRLTPAQVGMQALLGARLPMGMPEDWTMCQRIKHGHDFLVGITRIDLGYDPSAWHDHLRSTNAGGYRWSNKHLGISKQIKITLAREEWQQAVAELEAKRSAANHIPPPKPDPSTGH